MIARALSWVVSAPPPHWSGEIPTAVYVFLVWLPIAYVAVMAVIIGRDDLAVLITKKPWRIGDYDVALRRLSRLRLWGPTQKMIENEAHLLREAGRYAEAEPRYRIALTGCGPRSRHLLLVRLGETLGYMGRYEDGERFVDEALQLGDRDGIALTAKAHLLSLTGRYAEAEPYYRRALIACVPSFRWLILTCLFETFAHLGQYEKGEQCLDDAIQLGDRYGIARAEKAHMLLLQDTEPLKALGLITEAMDAPEAPRLPQTTCYRWATKAWALALLSRHQEADAAIVQALENVHVEFRAAVAETYWNIGKASVAMSRTESALEHFRSAHDADPNGLYGALAVERDRRATVTAFDGLH